MEVRGADYDFYGSGLDIHWNDRDRRLQSLLISHGKKLIVKHPSALQRMSTSTTQPVSFLTPSPSTLGEGRGEGLVSNVQRSTFNVQC